MQERRLVVVHNPHSSEMKADPGRIRRDVFQDLQSESIHFGVIETQYPDYDDNVELVSDILLEGDRVLVASGDGVASQVANAALRFKEVDVAFMAYGGFNDLAHTFETQNVRPSVLATTTSVEDITPLTITVDDDFLRYAIGYMTFGEAARASSDFMNDDERKLVEQHGKHKMMLRSLGRLGIDYLRRRKDIELPPFAIDGQRQPISSDIVALNLGRMASLKNIGWRERPDTFTFEILNGRNPFDYAGFILNGSSRGIKGKQENDVELRFDTPTTLVGQSEGEAVTLKDIRSLRIAKKTGPSDPTLHVVLAA